MIRLYTFLFLFGFVFTQAVAQVEFSDDFESYSTGDYIGVQSSEWTTWSGTTGNAEDAAITTDQALSGTNSIHFVGAANGGPQDVVLPFGNTAYSTGVFNFSMAVYVRAGAGAYWNFQGETTIGQVWAHNCTVFGTGDVQFTNAGNETRLSTVLSLDTWNVIDYAINLDTDVWTVSVNGDCLGSFFNENAQVASLDLFPLGGHDFYVDDVSFSHTADAPVRQYDASLEIGDLGSGGLTGMSTPVFGTMTNQGEEVIVSAELQLTSPSGVETFTVDNIAIAKGATTEFMLPEEYTLVDGQQELVLEVLSLNGGSVDEDPCNSKSGNSLLGATPAEGKGVLIEEGTGTWCGWCPRGAVFLDALTDKYGKLFASIAVHNGDPMVVSGYDGQHGFSGYPGITVNRASASTGFGSLGNIELPFLQSITEAPAGTFELEGSYDGPSRVLNLQSTVTANEDMNTDYAVSIVLIEDGVTGTGNGWSQSNFYAGGGQGPMGGYENLPNPVPAEDIVYDHVARAVPLGYDGSPLNSAMTAGNSESYDYSIMLNDEWEVTEMDIVMILHNPDGTINNAYKAAMTELFTTQTVDVNPIGEDISLYPNPTSGDITLELTTEESKVIDVKVVNALGQTLMTDRFTSVGESQHQLKVEHLASGTYYTVMTSGTQTSIVQFTKD